MNSAWTIQLYPWVEFRLILYINSIFQKTITSSRFNISGTLLLSCSMDKTIKVWDLQGKNIKTLTEHTRYVNCLAVNSDSTVFVSGSNDRTLLIWDLTNSLSMDTHLTGARSVLFNLASSQNEIPVDFICPITHEIMTDPVIAEGMALRS